MKRHQPLRLTILSALCALAWTGSTQAGESYRRENYSKRIQEPAAEAMGHFYWAVMGGVNIEQAADIDDINTSIGRFERGYESDASWFAGLKFGYEFESNAPVHAALELEGLYTQVDGGVNARGGIFEATSEGDIHAAAIMFNALVKFKPVWRFRPYLGAGVGVGYVDREDSDTSIRVGGRQIATRTRDGGDDFTFAYQGIAGFDWWVTDRWTLFTEYKALVFNNAVGFHNYLNHLVGLGVRVKF